MKKNNFLLSLGCALALIGPATISSSFNYTKGTKYLEKGKYHKAVKYLEKAVALDPTMSRNHNNLASAYLFTGNIDKAWYESRQAVLCLQDNPCAISTFWNIYEGYVTARGLDREGVPLQTVLDTLGIPDIMMTDSNGGACIMYGLSTMTFSNGKLIK